MMICRAFGILIVAVVVAGCGERERETGAIQSQSDEVTSVAFNASGGLVVEFSVPDMMCPDSCAVKTKEILAEQPGAKDVNIDFETKTARVAVEESAFDAEQALAALADHGFDHSTLKLNDAQTGSASPEPNKQPAG